MSARLAPGPSRRSFLKFSRAAAAGVLALPWLQLPAEPGRAGLRLGSALALPGWPLISAPEQLLQTAANQLDAVLVPAYLAAMLIQAGRLQPQPGPAGRPHDPEGHYTLPFAYRLTALRYPAAVAAPKTASWAELWSTPNRGTWPAGGRVAAGIALLRRGYSPNDTHPGHLALAAADLAQLSPRLERAPAGTPHAQPQPALVLADPADLGRAPGLRLPAEGVLLIEYDWVITASAERAAAARQFIAGLRPADPWQPANASVRLIPLMPLPPAAQAQHIAIWDDLAVQPSS